jgi:hypothetical protein
METKTVYVDDCMVVYIDLKRFLYIESSSHHPYIDPELDSFASLAQLASAFDC